MGKIYKDVKSSGKNNKLIEGKLRDSSSPDNYRGPRNDIMLEEKIKQELELIRPHLQMDGGDVEFVEFDEATGVLKLRLMGHCVGCPMSQVTLQEGIGRTIKEKIPEIKEVISV